MECREIHRYIKGQERISMSCSVGGLCLILSCLAMASTLINSDGLHLVASCY